MSKAADVTFKLDDVAWAAILARHVSGVVVLGRALRGVISRRHLPLFRLLMLQLGSLLSAPRTADQPYHRISSPGYYTVSTESKPNVFEL